MTNLGKICRDAFFYCARNITVKKVAYASVVTSVSLAALACLSLKSKSGFRWPVAIATSTSSAFFFFLWLVLSRPAMTNKNIAGEENLEIQKTPAQVDYSSASSSSPIRENNP